MEILVGKYNGFCGGVKNTLTKVEEALSSNPTGLDCLGEIIHNKQVVEELENKGLRIINSITEARDKVVIRAHGTTKDIYDYAQAHNIEILDLTCPNVLKIHEQVESFVHDGYFIFLFGVKNHPETIGTYSFCGNNSYLIEDTLDVSSAISRLFESQLKNVLIISQTTFSSNLFDELTKYILDNLDDSFNIHIEKSICNATNLRQIEASEISSKVDLVIIIGGKNSSNTKKLYEVSSQNCKNVLYIQTKDDLDLNFVKGFKKCGIIAGASTPDSIIEEVINAVKTL